MTVRELLARMGADEFSEWVAYDRIHPLPDPYLAAGIVAAANARLWGAKGREADPQTYLPYRSSRPATSGPRGDGAALAARIRRAKEAANRQRT